VPRTHHPSRATLLLPKSARQDVDTKSDEPPPKETSRWITRSVRNNAASRWKIARTSAPTQAQAAGEETCNIVYSALASTRAAVVEGL
jgi:hypothetical protein